jgi:hypothetical protein
MIPPGTPQGMEDSVPPLSPAGDGAKTAPPPALWPGSGSLSGSACNRTALKRAGAPVSPGNDLPAPQRITGEAVTRYRGGKAQLRGAKAPCKP